MKRNIYALLVGIDNYPYPTFPLKGCINDIEAVTNYLKERITTQGYETHLKILKDQEATRNNVIRGFQEFLCQGKENDIVLFYYSGHGSQEQTPPEFWHLEPDRLDETLVCWDSRSDKGWDLADKEIAQLIAEVAQKAPHIIVILDCCHSGSGTREDGEYHGIRGVPMDLRQRPFSSFITLEDTQNLALSRDAVQNLSQNFLFSSGEHLLLAACRDQEKAQEYYDGNQYHGAFSYFLLDTLKKTNGSITYRDLFKRTNALIRSQILAQSPQLETSHSAHLDQLFLDGAITQRPPYFTVSYDHRDGWVIDAGAVHGIPSVSGEETTRLAIFPFNSTLETLCQLSQAILSAKVTEVLPHLSYLSLSEGSEILDPELTYKAILTSLPLPPLGVYLQGDAPGIALVRQALQTGSWGEKPSLYICEVDEPEKAEFCLLADEEQYTMTRRSGEGHVGTTILGYTAANATQVIQRLEHIARWQKIITLSSTATSSIQSDAVMLHLYQGDLEITEPQIRLEYREIEGKWQPPALRIKLRNTSQQSLYIALISLSDRYAVNVGFFPTGGIWLEPDQEAWAMGGKLIYAKVPKDLWQQGITEFKDILKLIISTHEFDATLLAQDSIEGSLPPSARDQGKRQTSTLHRLMHRIQTRDLSADPEEELWDDWVTSQLVITTVRPQPVPSNLVN